MAQMRRDFQGGGNVETLPRAHVHAIGDGVPLTLCIARQVCALGQILAQQSIRVFVGAALPRAVGSGKEHPNRQPLRQAFVLRPSRFLDRRSRFGAAARAHAGVFS